ncbi:DUF3310 domain-containing protein [Mammaliicoccus sciuri]|uniref:DUF3310 domain-containing protein n=1 Tax=Mammaliicoccus sciuri TaxID=1296 RepID=UPI00195D132A|nr:DUF3310 domain-containing protein [Mammaliicoccus sciuri]MCD8846352.1 DUF3310 domain-containing protein [Mammaliicoccus sciuri]MCH5141556.1 DUF3310 domain-containing protein [Mammaliicoccus sciuri]MEB8104319.1 DUF3310 domain-containing protein [Mammaliicoccus sciuri]WQJ70529.1 DUF3310 domain-containing protein [Mammaliicoccus sciuri]
MEFKAGDRVHVTRLDGKEVDFYATLKETRTDGVFYLIDCTNWRYENVQIYTPKSKGFGPNRTDYYTLATDEEDTEEPVIQRLEDIEQSIEQQKVYIEKLNHDPVNKPSNYMLGDIEVKDIIAIVADKYHKGSVAHNVASALEYQMRAPGKNGLEDIKKARKCLDFAIENWE